MTACFLLPVSSMTCGSYCEMKGSGAALEKELKIHTAREENCLFVHSNKSYFLLPLHGPQEESEWSTEVSLSRSS